MYGKNAAEVLHQIQELHSTHRSGIAEVVIHAMEPRYPASAVRAVLQERATPYTVGHSVVSGTAPTVSEALIALRAAFRKKILADAPFKVGDIVEGTLPSDAVLTSSARLEKAIFKIKTLTLQTHSSDPTFHFVGTLLKDWHYTDKAEGSLKNKLFGSKGSLVINTMLNVRKLSAREIANLDTTVPKVGDIVSVKFEYIEQPFTLQVEFVNLIFLTGRLLHSVAPHWPTGSLVNVDLQTRKPKVIGKAVA